MPTICRFDGVEIDMYYNDHAPPHFHAFCGEDEALIEWSPPNVYRGSLPGRVLRKVLDWAALRAPELNANWALARQGMAVHPVAPPP